MRSATSFFDKTLIGTDVRRYWPILFLYTGIWIIMLPVIQWVELGYSSYPGDYLYDMMLGGLIMALLFGGMMAMALYSYLMNSRSVGLMHSLPATRHTQFFSHFAAGMAMLAAGKLVVAALTVLVQLLYGGVDLKAICLWFVVVTLLELFFFALGILCTMVTGWLLAMPVIYAAANCAVIVLTVLLQVLGELFYFGYSSGAYPAITRWLTPVYALAEVLTDSVYTEDVPANLVLDSGVVVENYVRGPRVMNPDAIPVLAVYTIAALALLAIAYLLYRRRASESAGDPVAFSWARPIFRCGISLFGGLALGFGLYSILTMNSDSLNMPVLLVCMVLMGVLCCFAAEMVIRKSFRVFRKGWPSALAMAAVLVVICVAAKMDITGYEQHVPTLDEVVSVEINLPYEDVYVNECLESESIQSVMALHEAVAAGGVEPAEGDRYYNIRIEYELADGSYMRRRYTLSWERTQENEEIVSALAAVLNTEEIRYKTVLGGSTDPDTAYVLRGGYITGRLMNYEQQLTAEQAQRVYQAVLQDLANGAGGHEPLQDNSEICSVYIELDTGEKNIWIDVIRPDFTETAKVLVELGVDSQTIFMTDEDQMKYAEIYGW